MDYIARKRLASPRGFAAGGNAVSQGGVGNAADTLEAMLFGVEVLPEAFEQVTIFAFGSIAPISPPVLGAPTMGVAKNARLYWGATVLADFQAAATQNGVWAVTATVNKAGTHAQVSLLATRGSKWTRVGLWHARSVLLLQSAMRLKKSSKLGMPLFIRQAVRRAKQEIRRVERGNPTVAFLPRKVLNSFETLAKAAQIRSNVIPSSCAKNRPERG